MSLLDSRTVVAGRSQALLRLSWLSYPKGVIQNIRFENFFVAGAASGPSITQANGDNGSYAGTSKMEISNIAFVDWNGTIVGGKGS